MFNFGLRNNKMCKQIQKLVISVHIQSNVHSIAVFYYCSFVLPSHDNLTLTMCTIFRKSFTHSVTSSLLLVNAFLKVTIIK